MTTTQDLIKRVALFENLSAKQQKSIAEALHEKNFSPGEDVVTEGDRAYGFFVIESGTAEVRVHGHVRATLGPGDYFGEIALIDDGPRSATVTATTDLRCQALASWVLRPLVAHDADIAWKMLINLAKRIREAETELFDTTTLEAKSSPS